MSAPKLGGQAVVVGSSRRFVHLLDKNGATIKAQSSSKAVDLTVGDSVIYGYRKEDPVVTEILPAKNYLARSYRDETKKIAANLDQLFIVTAVGQLFNTFFLDRIMTVAACESIPYTLVVNKIDLGDQETRILSDIYERIGIPVVYTSAKAGKNIELLEQSLRDPDLRIVALGGISGVGKSTILNQLIPGTERKTAEVSERTGQGKQTTTQAYGYMYERDDAAPLLVIDLPGIQNFGVQHLSKQSVAESFPEFIERVAECEFDNCSHIGEQKCAIKDALERGEIAPQRYDSYVRMIDEIEEAKPY
ncbi:MAG: ribosome small subunit-dependent GTPase A [Deltaproteobacteria bacterium]|nr:ribosome small subunit-dependent GTPase A [Deltaproteobacteria bacterium]